MRADVAASLSRGAPGGAQLTALIVVEGTCGSGKTTLLRAAKSAFAHYDVRLFTQRDTYAPIAPHEDAGTLDDATNKRELLKFVARLRAIDRPNQLMLVDTFHATHLARVGALSLESFAEVDRSLAAFSPLIVILRISAASIHERTIVGRRGTGFYRYARKFGKTERERATYFHEEQLRMIHLLNTNSDHPTVVLDADAPKAQLAKRFVAVVRDHIFKR